MYLTVKMWWSELVKGFINKKKQISWQTSLFFKTEEQALSDTLQYRITAEQHLTLAML